MTRPATPPVLLLRPVAAWLALVLLLGACTSPGPEGRSSPEPAPSEAPSPSPTAAPSFAVSFALREVGARATDGRIPPSEATELAEDVRATMEEYYSIAFVDPGRWAGGDFTSLYRLFAADLRGQARDDLAHLTLGEAATSLDAVRPLRAEMDVRFLADRGRRPVAAVTRVVFSGTARAGEVRGTVSHAGEYVLRRFDDRWRIVAYDVQGRLPAIGELQGRSLGAKVERPLPPDDRLFVLVIGSDARPGQSVTRTRADSIHIVGVNRRQGRVSILGIPRDAWVSIPGAGSDKINAALARGGPELVVRTVEHVSGIEIDAYLLTGFRGFQDAVAAVRGFDIRIPFPISDRYAHARFRRGPTHLTAREALAFARARHALSDGDFGRSLNQGRLMIAALATMRDQLSRGRAVLLRWVLAGAQHLRTDLSLEELFDLAAAAAAIEPRRVRNRVVSGRIGNIGGRSVVLLDERARASFRDLARDAVLGG